MRSWQRSMKIKWREVFKFLSGVEFAGSMANFYLYIYDISVPFLHYTIPARLLGIRAAIQFIAFLVFVYFGYLKK